MKDQNVSDPSSEPSAPSEPLETSEQKQEVEKPTFLQVTLSVMAAAIGVQSDKNRQRDFSQSSPLPYIVGGILFTVVFVLTIIGVVMLVLPD